MVILCQLIKFFFFQERDYGGTGVGEDLICSGEFKKVSKSL